MRRLLTWAAAAVLPALLVSALNVGCTGGDKTEDNKAAGDVKATEGKGKPKPSALTAVEGKGKATIKGKIKFAGEKPNFKPEDDKLLAEMKAKDEAHCVAGAKPEDLQQQHWRIADDGGLQYVFVWIQPPDGKFFKIDPATLPADLTKDKVLDQPKCAFEPHAFVLFPKYRDPADPKKMKETGQKLVIKNSNQTAHNTDFSGGDDNPQKNNQIAPGSKIEQVFEPSAHEIDFKCTIHPWMNAYARAFDHPYATVTGKDGTYEIKDAPAGAEVHLVIWHELGGFGKDGKKGKAVTLKEGDNTFDFEMGKGG
ncbi:MAG TPA: hypothetical protein VFW33_12220 [Gemmataceae bacterium]|nr:hypothetical protein [Gemmataceae bacterium]